MFDLRYSCIFLLLSSGINNVSADVYKWLDDDGNVHYSQKSPPGVKADAIKSPQAVDPTETQKRVDILIKEQKIATKEKHLTDKERKIAAEKRKKQRENCSKARHNLKLYEDNPHARVLDDEDEATYITEEKRQENISKLKKYINDHCHKE